MAELDLELDARLGFATDKLASAAEKIARQQRRWFPRTIQGSVVSVGAGTVVIDFGSPYQGKLWNPVGIALAGPSPTFVLAALTRAAFTIGDLNNPTPGQIAAMLEGATTAAYTASFGTEALWAYNTENCFLQAVVSGVTTIYAALRVREYNQDDIEPRNA